MGAFFESALLFSLAVLIILIGLLVYYFKGRIVELEQNHAKCLEIISDVYNSHALLKQTVTAMLMEAAEDSVHEEHEPMVNGGANNGYINVEIKELQEPDDSSRVSYTDDEDDSIDESIDENKYNKIKTIHVDLDAPETYNIDELDVEEIEALSDNEHESDLEPVVLDASAPEIHVLKTDAEPDAQPSTTIPAAEDYKKMSAVALRGYIISKGIQTDAAKLRRMSKQELIDLVSQA